MSAFRRNGLTVGAVLLALAIGALIPFKRRAAPPAPRHSLLGRLVPNVAMKTPGGAPVMLRDRLAGRPALLIVMSPAQCASCANVPLELRILNEELPGVQTLFIGSSGTVAEFGPYLAEMKIERAALIDERRQLLDSLGVGSEPLTILCDSKGRVLFVDARSIAEAAQYPIGRLLHDVKGLLTVEK